jgi:hypothetical protein
VSSARKSGVGGSVKRTSTSDRWRVPDIFGSQASTNASSTHADTPAPPAEEVQQHILRQSPPTTPAELVCEPSMLTRSRRVLRSVTQQHPTTVDSRECSSKQTKRSVLRAAHLSPIGRIAATQTAPKSIANNEQQQAIVHSTPKATAVDNNVIQRENNRKVVFVQ